MPEFLVSIALPLTAGLLLTLLVDVLATVPLRSLHRRPLRCWLLHIALMTLAFCIELLAFQRPWFACSQMLVLQGVVLAISAVKMSSMREPFVFQDFEYFIDMLRHPRLYLPFFGIGKLIAILCAVGVMIYASVHFEASLTQRIGPGNFIGGCLLVAIAALILLWLCTRRPFALSFNAQNDLRSLGLCGSLAAYAAAENRAHALPDRFSEIAIPASVLPHIVAVQSESFFDARRMWPGIHPEIYAWLDRVRTQAWQHGLLGVPAIGANTVRTEFAFLSGLRDEDMGVHRFNPYRKLPERGVCTLAHRLRTAGYRTVCIHPYMADFYRRDMVFPLFGFDEFIDVQAFGETDRAGPFIGDIAVAARVNDLLAASSEKPLFVFVITMENHGPLHMEHVSDEEMKALFPGGAPAGFDDLAVYLRHVRNAGVMLETLCGSLAAQFRPGRLCWYGDHVPIMPSVFAHAGFDDARTDYFIWDSAMAHRQQPAAKNIAVNELAATLLGGPD